jgi:hypothetical protein
VPSSTRRAPAIPIPSRDGRPTVHVRRPCPLSDRANSESNGGGGRKERVAIHVSKCRSGRTHFSRIAKCARGAKSHNVIRDGPLQIGDRVPRRGMGLASPCARVVEHVKGYAGFARRDPGTRGIEDPLHTTSCLRCECERILIRPPAMEI